jgi:outer membrane receptor protein involved in Fe transport
LTISAARLQEFEQQAGELTQILVDAGVPAQNVGDLVQQEFRPEWRSSFLATWSRNQWGAGLSANYVGEVFDIQTTADSDTPDPGAPLPVDSYLKVNMHGDYVFETGESTETRVRPGIRNLFDEEPPLADEAFGYEGSLHSWMGRYLYADVNIRF